MGKLQFDFGVAREKRQAGILATAQITEVALFVWWWCLAGYNILPALPSNEGLISRANVLEFQAIELVRSRVGMQS